MFIIGSLRNEQCLSKNIWRPKKCEKNYYNCAKPKVAQKCADTCSYCEGILMLSLYEILIFSNISKRK